MSWGVLAPKLLGDADIGWHIRNGEMMMQSHRVTRADVFSGVVGSDGQIETGRPWYSWEWLYDLGIGATHHWLGLNGVVFFTAVLLAWTFAYVFRLTLMRGANVVIAAIFLLLTFGAASIHLFTRPHVISWLLAVIWFQWIDSAEESESQRKRLLWLPATMLLWINLHGGFVLGFVLLALYATAAGFRYFAVRDERPRVGAWLKTLGVVAALSMVASMANPYGYKLHVHVYRYLSDSWLMNHIDEFKSPNFHGLPQQCFAALLLVTVIALSARRESLRVSHGLVLLFAAYSGFYASRNLPTASILFMLIASPILSRAIADSASDKNLPRFAQRLFARIASSGSRAGAMEFRLRGHAWTAVFLVMSFAVCVNHGKLGLRQLMNAQFDAKRFPVEAGGYLQKTDRPLILAPDSWGGYLIYRLYPDYRVYVDDRHDFYGAKFLKNYLAIFLVAPDWKEQLERTHVSFVLAPSDSSLANILKETPNWRLVHEDKTAALFERE